MAEFIERLSRAGLQNVADGRSARHAVSNLIRDATELQ
jgi:hypothetical protein